VSIELTKKQEEGLRVAVQRYNQGYKYTIISGYAGSGKSTLIKFIIDALPVDPDKDVAYAAFTGKAATVLQQKGCQNATTAHKLLYRAKPMPNGTYKFIPRIIGEIEYKVIVIDEVSMLPKPMWDLLMKHNIYILATGDPGQLPPVNPEDDNHMLDNPHVFLDEIMRQAQDSEIIRLSMHIREGLPLSTFGCEGQQVQIFDKTQVVSGMYDWADQILCATNAQRTKINNFVRQQKGFGSEPEVGDKVISLRNHWDFASSSGDWALTNGSIGTIEYMTERPIWVPKYIYDKGPIPYLFTDVVLDDGDKFNSIPIDYNSLKNGEMTLNPKQTYMLNRQKDLLDAPYEFAYAYAITCHKAQGSEWNKVLVFEEWFPNVAEEHKRWLYTAATRASEKLVIIKK
jgi:exodeoxyribonuclease-5